MQRWPLEEDSPGRIHHLRGRYECLRRYRMGNVRLIYEVDRDKREIRLLSLALRDKTYIE